MAAIRSVMVLARYKTKLVELIGRRQQQTNERSTANFAFAIFVSATRSDGLQQHPSGQEASNVLPTAFSLEIIAWAEA